MRLVLNISIILISLLLIGFNLFKLGRNTERVKYLDIDIACMQEASNNKDLNTLQAFHAYTYECVTKRYL